MYYTDDPHHTECPHEGCTQILQWIPPRITVKGKSWFKPGYDLGLGEYISSVDERDRVMKEKGAYEACGGGDVGIGDAGPRNPQEVMPLSDFKKKLGK